MITVEALVRLIPNENQYNVFVNDSNDDLPSPPAFVEIKNTWYAATGALVKRVNERWTILTRFLLLKLVRGISDLLPIC